MQRSLNDAVLAVLSLDAAMEGASASHETGRMGVQIELAGGGSALVRFNENEAGGRLEIRGPSGEVLADVTFDNTVAELPLFSLP